jgi:hypothetical protein
MIRARRLFMMAAPSKLGAGVEAQNGARDDENRLSNEEGSLCRLTIVGY